MLNFSCPPYYKKTRVSSFGYLPNHYLIRYNSHVLSYLEKKTTDYSRSQIIMVSHYESVKLTRDKLYIDINDLNYCHYLFLRKSVKKDLASEI